MKNHDPSILDIIARELLSSLQIKYHSNLVALLFYGSRVRGDNFPDSDLDIIIILDQLNEDQMLPEISRICGKLTREYHIKISPYTISRQDYHYGCKKLFPFNLGVHLGYRTIFGSKFIETAHKFIDNAIQQGKLKVYPRSGIFIHG